MIDGGTALDALSGVDGEVGDFAVDVVVAAEEMRVGGGVLSRVDVLFVAAGAAATTKTPDAPVAVLAGETFGHVDDSFACWTADLAEHSVVSPLAEG